MTQPQILIAGIGNIFLGDDAFGVEVVRRLSERPQAPGVRVVDYGIRGLDLAYALLDGPDLAILVDALPRGEAPGTLYVFEPDLGEADDMLIDAHSMNPMNVIRMVQSFGGACPPLRIVGCEPETFGSDEEPIMGLSAAVAAAVDGAIELVERVVHEFVSPPAAQPAGQG